MSTLNLYQIHVTEENRMRLYRSISNIRPDEDKIHFIGWSQGYIRMEVSITEEELSFLKLAVPFGIKEVRIQQWPNQSEV